jgi:hypothetical protein
LIPSREYYAPTEKIQLFGGRAKCHQTGQFADWKVNFAASPAWEWWLEWLLDVRWRHSWWPLECQSEAFSLFPAENQTARLFNVDPKTNGFPFRFQGLASGSTENLQCVELVAD